MWYEFCTEAAETRLYRPAGTESGGSFMNRKHVALAALAFCILLGAPRGADATSTYSNQWRAAYPGVCTTLYNLSCSVCHTAVPALNAYGTDYLNQGLSATAIENLDSDGDGYTNGQEILVDCTNPASSASHGTVDEAGQTWSAIKALYH